MPGKFLLTALALIAALSGPLQADTFGTRVPIGGEATDLAVDQPRGVLVINDPKECQPMRERFDEIWESSVPAVSANTTGL